MRHPYATFSSHNQHLFSNRFGVFFTYAASRSGAASCQQYYTFKLFHFPKDGARLRHALAT